MGTTADRLRASVEQLSSADSRVAGYPGCERAGEFIGEQFSRWGVQDVRSERFPVTVPVEQGGSLRLVGTDLEFPGWGLWPNLVRTPSLPPEGLVAPLVDGGDGSLAALAGRPLDGRVLLLDFNTWDRWLTAAGLGVGAVVFVAPEVTSWRQSAAKFLDVPLDLPRLWISREAGARLRAKVGAGEAGVLVTSRMEWQTRPTANIVGVIPGRDPALRGDTVAVQAYYDGISVVPGLAPAAESACSIAALLELVRYLHEHPPSRTVVVAATSAHFQDLQGIDAFLDRHVRRFGPAAQAVPEPLGVDLFVGLDLSSGGQRLGVWHNTNEFALRRYFAPYGRWYTGYAAAVAGELGLDAGEALVNGITPIRGREWPSYVPGGLRTDGQKVLAAGIPALSFVTVNDVRWRLDSPLDLPADVDYDNLARQVELLTRVLSRSFDDPGFLAGLEDLAPVAKDRLRSLTVRVRSYPRHSQVPDAPVAGALVAIGPEAWEPDTPKGVRSLRYAATDGQGLATISGLPAATYAVGAYGLDQATGQVVLAPDLSERARQHHGAPVGGGRLTAAVTGARNEKTVVCFPCVGSGLVGLVDPRFLTPVAELTVLDAHGVSPRQYGYALGPSAGVVFAAAGGGGDGRVKLIAANRLLLLGSEGSGDEAQARGSGYRLGQGPLASLPMLAAQDMWNLDEVRLQRMRRHAIENRRVSQLHEQAAGLLADARDARRQLDWPRHVARARAALGLEARAYPEVVGTLNDVIRGMVFFLALLIPAAFFGERLLIGATDIRRQLVGLFGLLALIWILISQVHPAFAIGQPLVILLSFVIMATAAFVIALVFTRFEGHMAELRSQATGVHQMDVSRVGASYVAFMLGISNLRRRKLRTTLTLTTLVLLTFTVLSFTSYESDIRFISVPRPNAGSYAGVLVRDLGWNQLSDRALDYARTHFGAAATVTPRNWFVGVDESGRAQRLELEVTCGQRSVPALGLLGLAPGEAEVTAANQTLVAGSFFTTTDESTCLLTDQMAASLGVSASDVGRATVRVMGRTLTVRGIVAASRLGALRDLDDEPLTPADFALSPLEGAEAAAAQPRSGPELVSQIRAFTHLAAGGVLVLPYDVLRDLGGSLRSVAVRFAPGADGRRLMEDYLLRLAVTLFAGLPSADGERIPVFSCTSVGTTSVGGLGALLVPMLIAGLIVLNTMLGAVYERSREIGIYSSVGLAPAHIGMLFVAESCVYAVLGITLGYLLGQGTGRLLVRLELTGGVNLNYSSLAAVVSSLLVMAVVLLSTVYPARMAARAAVPDVVRRWVPPPPAGKRWEFQFPFMVSGAEIAGLSCFLKDYFQAFSEESVGQFLTRDVRLSTRPTAHGPEYAIGMEIWLAPLELGVSQHLVITALPEAEHGVYGLFFAIQWLSGEHEAWLRVNRRFIKVLREEFLIWYSLRESVRAEYRRRLDLLPAGQALGPITAPAPAGPANQEANR